MSGESATNLDSEHTNNWKPTTTKRSSSYFLIVVSVLLLLLLPACQASSLPSTEIITPISSQAATKISPSLTPLAAQTNFPNLTTTASNLTQSIEFSLTTLSSEKTLSTITSGDAAVLAQNIPDVYIATTSEETNATKINLTALSAPDNIISLQIPEWNQLLCKSFIDQNGNAYILTHKLWQMFTLTKIRPDGQVESIQLRGQTHLPPVCTAHNGNILFTFITPSHQEDSSHPIKSTLHFYRISTDLSIEYFIRDIEFLNENSIYPVGILPLSQDRFLLYYQTDAISKTNKCSYFQIIDLEKGIIEEQYIPIQPMADDPGLDYILAVDETLDHIIFCNNRDSKIYRYSVLENHLTALEDFTCCGSMPRMEQGKLIFQSYTSLSTGGAIVDPFSFEEIFISEAYPQFQHTALHIAPLGDKWIITTVSQAFIFNQDGQLEATYKLPETVPLFNLAVLEPLTPE